jgi:hypothetical protein
VARPEDRKADRGPDREHHRDRGEGALHAAQVRGSPSGLRATR